MRRSKSPCVPALLPGQKAGIEEPWIKGLGIKELWSIH